MSRFFDPNLTESMRTLVAGVAAQGSTAADAASLWGELIRGHRRVVDGFTTSHRCYLITEFPLRSRPPITPRNVDILERVLLGGSSKAVSIELGLSPSTIAASLRHSLVSLGHLGAPSKVPLVLAMLAHGARGLVPPDRLRTTEVLFGNGQFLVVWSKVPELSPVLPPAVREVVSMHADGKSHAEIAARRRVSPRTVANQLATAFHRLDVSGRAGLVGYLIAAQARERQVTSSDGR